MLAAELTRTFNETGGLFASLWTEVTYLVHEGLQPRLQRRVLLAVIADIYDWQTATIAAQAARKRTYYIGGHTRERPYADGTGDTVMVHFHYLTDAQNGFALK